MSEMLSVIVDGMWRQGDKSLAVRLVADNGETLPGWQPGAHIDVHLPCGIIRQYSLTGTCGGESYLICVGRETASRGGSRYIHETLRPGQKLAISSRAICFRFIRQTGLCCWRRIGITPLYAMALQLEASGTPFTLHYYVKKRENAAFVREVSGGWRNGECIIHASCEEKAHARGLARICQLRMTGYMYTPAAHSNLWPKSVT
jgi:vanillate O-demethylase ferredoxin subunit